MLLFLHPRALTSQQVVELTKQHNYGTWRFQKGWNPCTLPTPKVAT